MFGLLARAFMINRILGGGRRSRYGGRYGGRYGRGRGRGRTGFFGPMPYYTRQTRGGSRVSVSGCCLPIPLALVTSFGLGARTMLRR